MTRKIKDEDDQNHHQKQNDYQTRIPSHANFIETAGELVELGIAKLSQSVLDLLCCETEGLQSLSDQLHFKNLLNPSEICLAIKRRSLNQLGRGKTCIPFGDHADDNHRKNEIPHDPFQADSLQGFLLLSQLFGPDMLAPRTKKEKQRDL